MKMRDYIEQNIENIDPEMILEAAMERNDPEPIIIIKKRNDLIKRISTTAACIVFSVIVIISFILMRNSITPPPTDSVTETEIFTDNETETETDTETNEVTTDEVTETEPVTETETEPPIETEPIPEELPDTADFWLDRKAVADAALSLLDAWGDHYMILEACAEALHPDYGEVTVGGLAMSKNIYLCDNPASYEDYGRDHHIKVQFWSLDFENGTSKYYIIYEYQHILLGIEECSASMLYDTAYLYSYIKEDERFTDTILSKLNEEDPGRDDEVISYNMSSLLELKELITLYPSPLGYNHVFEYFSADSLGIRSMLRIITADMENVYYSFTFDTVNNAITALTPHGTLAEVYSAVGYNPNEVVYTEGTIYESERLLVYFDDVGDLYAENKENGVKYLLIDSAIDIEAEEVTNEDGNVMDDVSSEDTAEDTYDTEILPEDTDSEDTVTTDLPTEEPTEPIPEEFYVLSLGAFDVYEDRYIIYEVTDKYGTLGVGIYDADTGYDHYIGDMELIALYGGRVFVADTDGVYYTVIDDVGEYELINVDFGTDDAIAYSISPNGTHLAVLDKNPEDNGKEYRILVKNIDTGGVYEYFFTEYPRAEIISDFGIWTEKYLITGSEGTSNLDSQLYMIPIK